MTPVAPVDPVDPVEPARPVDTVASIMSRRVVAVRSDCDLKVAVDTFLHCGVTHLVVVDPDRTVVGLLSTERALAGLGATGRRRVADHAVAIRGRVRPDDDIRRAAEVMLEELVDAVPVADDGRVVGIVRWSDIVAHVAGEHLRERP